MPRREEQKMHAEHSTLELAHKYFELEKKREAIVFKTPMDAVAFGEVEIEMMRIGHTLAERLIDGSAYEVEDAETVFDGSGGEEEAG